MREREVEAYLVREVKKVGGFTRKVQFIGHRGAPDRLVCIPHDRIHFLVELKRPKGGILESHQVREHKRLQESGFRVYIAYTKEAVDLVLRKEFIDATDHDV